MHREEFWEEMEEEHTRRGTAYAKVLRWAKCGMFEGKRVEREDQSDKTGARAHQQAPLDQGEALRFYLTDHVKPWKALGRGWVRHDQPGVQ